MSEEEARNCSNLGQWARHEEVGSSLGRESDVKVCKEEGKKEKSGSEFQKERPIPAVHQPDDEWQDSKKPETMEDVDPVGIVKSEEEGDRTSSLVSTQDNRTPGAFHVGSGGDDVTSEDAEFEAENPVTAELVDTDVEKQLLQEQVNISLQRERAKAQIAVVVQERCCDRRRTLVGVIVLSLLTILGIILGVMITKDDGPPPTPVPPIEKIIETLSLVSSDGGEALQTPGSAQHDALSWLANDTFQGYYTDEKLIQRYSLATLFFSTNGKNWFNKSMWLDEGDECDRWWQLTGGILCDSLNSSITSLELGSNNLVGTIPAEIGLLKSLVSLGLSYNDFLSERIPTEIAELTSLKELNLKTCKLSGSVPEQLINVTTLNSLDLSENSLEGTFVADIDKLTNLETLSLYQNTFKSRLPNDISKLTNLKQLNLFSNELSGLIPSSVGNLILLTEISLYENHFNGPLPSELGLLTSLARLNLNDCNFTGSIPPELMTLPLLQLLYLQENSLTGTMPEISALSNLGKSISR
jgi:Leucine-rich repeat (LRR) protein